MGSLKATLGEGERVASIVRAGVADAERILALTRLAFAPVAAEIGRTPEPLLVDYPELLAGSLAFVVPDPDGALAAALILQEKPEALLIWSIAVRPDRQGTGLGRRLLAFAEEEARRLGYAKMTLYTNALRHSTIAYYARFGYGESAREALPGRVLVHMDKPLPWKRNEPMHAIKILDGADKATLYEDLLGQLDGLLAGESDVIANAANLSALIFHGLADLNWAGFYVMRDGGLVLGPFQGKPACVRIPVGKGVCGTAVARRETILVPNVHAFPGHIACDAASRSEIVVPLLVGDDVIGVLDLDSPREGRFDAEDQTGLEALVARFLAHHAGARLFA